MKRTIFLILACLLLGGCASNSPAETPLPAAEAPAPPAAAETPVPEAAPAPLALSAFTEADSAAMSRFMSRNRCLIDGDVLYGLDFDGDLSPVLARYALRDGRPEDFQILCRGCVPEYLALEDGKLYFLNGGVAQSCDLKSKKCRTLADRPWQSLQVFDGALYYVDAEGRFCRCALDGKTGETLIDGPCDYAWAMPEGVIYQSERDGCCLRLRLWDGTDRRLTAAASYAPLRLGDTVWYAQKDREGSVLACVDLRDGTVRRCDAPEIRGAAELFFAGGEPLLRVFLAEDSRKQLVLSPGGREGTACAYSGYRLCDYVGEGLRVDAAYDPDGRLRCFVLVDGDGGELRYFGGQILNDTEQNDGA